MLPQKYRDGVLLGLLLLCISGHFALGEQTRSNQWQDGPINCHVCKGLTECAATDSILRKCENNDAQSCVTVFDDNGAVIERGCSDTVHATHGEQCLAKPEHCPTCGSSGCNGATSLSEYTECVHCDSATNRNCVWNPAAITDTKLCAGGCMTALYPIKNATTGHVEKYHLGRACLNDRDLDDREACASGNDAHCLACTTAKCNTHKLPETRNTCYYIENEDYDENIRECVTVSENAKCYMLFNDAHDVVDMGCSADLDADVLTELIKKKLLYECDGDNCNSFTKIPQPNDCMKCNSADDVNCATNPSAVHNLLNCRVRPYTQCYQLVNEEGRTERGCLADLEEEQFYECLTSSDGKCKICSDDVCNEEIIPEDRRKCYRCSSETDSTCHRAPNNSSICPLYVHNDTCVSVYDNGVTKRGCGSELSCASTGICEQCSGDNCNTAYLKREAEGIYGMFQDLPLNCYNCNGSACWSSLGLVNMCSGPKEQDCVTVFNGKGLVVGRGCENDIEERYRTHCTRHPEFCFNCKSNGCNTYDSAINNQTCLYCDASTNRDCLLNPSAVTLRRNCLEGCVSSLYTRKSNPMVQDFVRTCFEDIERDDRDACTAANNCVKCTTNDCNVDVLPKEGRKSCFHCSGSDCSSPVAHQCLGYAANDQCYIYFDAVSHVPARMGCKSDLAVGTVESNQKLYYLCDTNDCNTESNLPATKKCATCNSWIDVNCAIDPSKVTVATCDLPIDDCYVRVTGDGLTVRGCTSTLSNDLFSGCNNGTDKLCSACTTNDCNLSVYPSDRKSCYHCDSQTDAACESAPSASHICPLYSSADSCVTKIENGFTHRGCASELSCGNASRNTCRSCPTDNCNTVNLLDKSIGDPGHFTDLPLECYHCLGPSCATSLGNATKCETDLLDTCTTAFASNGTVVSRGCSAKLDDLCSADGGTTCYDCKSNGCNSAFSMSDYIDCIFCDARTSEDCLNNAGAVSRTRSCNKGCMTALYPRTDDAQPVYELLRTCLDDMDLDDQEQCTAGKDNKCVSCQTERCNTASLGTRKSCYQCSGTDCQEPKPSMCRAVMDHDQCYVHFAASGAIDGMGCKSDYDPSEIREFVAQQLMWLCDADNCNTESNLPTSQSCVSCNSHTDEACATHPESITDRTSCDKLPYTECYTRLLETGHTERGCLSALAGDQFYDCLQGVNATECLACTGAGCNQQLYPSDRLYCHVCSSEDSTSCESQPNASKVCPLYTAQEHCVSTLYENGTTVRGCSSSVECEAGDITDCRMCAGSNCNTIYLKRKSDGNPGKWQDLPLTCYTCSGESSCQTASATATCAETNYCMTVFGANGLVQKRGCSDEVENEYEGYCDSNPSNCRNCNSNECNSATSLNDYIDCVYCDSASNPNCAINPSAITERRKCNKHCMTALYPRSVNSTKYELSRSCLDDKDRADQTKCQQGDAHCVACSSAGCNVALVPEKRLSCYYCEGDSCTEASTMLCPVYQSDDQCYILFKSDNSVERMGCKSDLSDSYISSHIQNLYWCDDKDNCNSYENIPTPKHCVTCNSLLDGECATKPTDVTSVELCSNMPRNECYTRVIATDGSTVRGCVSSLSTTQINSCLGGNDANCNVCIGDRCNEQIFPEDRRSCHRCNSKEDPSCESKPTAQSICPIFDSNQGCGVKLVNGFTYRGCSREFICDDSDKQYCRMCYGSNDCNFADLASTNIGYPGKWQDVPINCYNCMGADCGKDSPGNVNMCQGNNDQNCGTVFAHNGTILQRGCSDSIFANEYSSYCDENPSHCKFCKSNGCNNVKSLDEYVDCLFCDGRQNSDCVLNVNAITRTRSCHQQCMTALYVREPTAAQPTYELKRTCLDDMDLDEREDCANGSLENCKACSDAKCNVHDIPESRHKCYRCSGQGCGEPAVQECVSYREHDQCFILFDSKNDVSRMGCASDMTDAELQANRRQLLLCDGDSCNTIASIPSPVSCASCNSTADRNCATNPDNIGKHTVCTDLPYTQCFTRLDENGVVHRGCLLDLNDDLFDDCSSGESSTCEICSSNSCNVNLYPADRLSCIRCDGAVSAACDDNPLSMASICPLYDDDEMCVTKVEAGRTIRGCRSEVNCRNSDIPGCRVCQGNNCNTVNLLAGAVGEPGRWQDLPLECKQCEGSACETGAVDQACSGNNLQNCMTVFGENNNVVRRGCSDAIFPFYSDYCDENPHKCITCKSNGCNDATSLDDFTDCYFCDSAENPDCATNVGNIRRTRKCHGKCMVALYPRTVSNDPAYELVRSCVDDMNVDDRELCALGEKEFCQTCDNDRCNTMPMPEQRYQCYKCSGDDCEHPTVQACTSYHRNEQCYTLYNNESSIIAMGCRSEFDYDVVTQLIADRKLLICNEEKCNSPESQPTPNVCSVCDSDRNPHCATSPALVGVTEKCTALPYTDCFTKITEFGSTIRGCHSSLNTPSFVGCLLNSDGLCETCTGDKCNENNVFPSDRLRCHQCSSDTDAGCISSPNSNKVCSVYSANDYCVTSLVDGITRRGCATSMRCDDENDSRTCRTCKGSGCNTADLVRLNSHGQPGKFQSLPISCLECVGEEDCATGSESETCSLNPFQNCMTVFNVDGKVVQRGCSDLVEQYQGNYCAANPDKCLGCNSNDCNTAVSLDNYVQCLHCDSEKNAACLWDATAITSKRVCHKHCMTALYKRDHDDPNPSYALTRTCWDDMETEDRDACAAGTLSNCKACSTANCNTEDLPTSPPRHSCYVCEGDGCQLPQAQSCLHYRADDKCYIRYDENRAIVSMGCGSDFTTAESLHLVMKQRLWYCDGQNCNTFDAQPSAQTCVLCSSRTDTKCAVEPSTLPGATTCRNTPYTQCYSRVLHGGATERGCLSSLYDEEFLGCLNGTSTTCSSCTGPYCNSEVFPADRAACHTCDSINDPNCADSPNSIAICPIFDQDETCVTAWNNGVTYRGCSSSVTCSSQKPSTCVHCTGNGCNDINLDEENDIDIGKWQDLPLRCLSCSGDACQSDTTTEIHTCEDNNLQQCVTVFNEAGAVVRRGCSDPVDMEYGMYCYENKDSCFNCKSNECNNATSTNEFVECVYCDTARNDNCVWDPLSTSTRKCQGSCMTALYPAFEGANPAYDLVRTCLNDKEAADQIICSDGKDKNCAACTGPNCNTVSLPENRHKCNICKGDCGVPASLECPLYRANDQCFIWFDEHNDVSEMGCVSSFRDQELHDIIKTKRVWICDGDNCNTFDKLPAPQVCAVCDSATDVSCAVSAADISAFDTCKNLPHTNCYTRINSAGRTVRGCLSDLNGDQFADCLLGTDGQCEICTGNGCNKEIYPADRTQCYTCTSADDENCESYPNKAMPCPIFRDTETCRTVLSGNTTIRGCSSQLYCDATDTKVCRSCTTTECNSIDLVNLVNEGPFGVWQSLPLRCHTCEGQHCLFSLGPAHTCAYNDEQDCMTVFNATGEVIRRGCADEVQDYEDLYCRQNPSLCFKCKSNECNFAWELSDYVECAFCDSLNNANCIQNPEYGNFSTRSCYKECMVAMMDNRVYRTCLDDREQMQQYICRSGDENNEICSSCTGPHCNKFNFPADRVKCHVCSNGACTTSASEYCTLYEKNDFCFARYNNNGKPDLLGCGSSQNSSTIDDWAAQNILYRCQGNECNELSLLPAVSAATCMSCNSSTNVNCVQSPTSVQTTETCPLRDSHCVVYIDAAGNTIRGCRANMPENEQSTCVGAGTCSACTGNRCNINTYPEGRRSCHICTSESDESCAENPNSLKICPVYSKDQRCVSKNTDGLIERGCENDLPCDTDDEENCQMCGMDACNVVNLSGAALMATGSLLLTLLLAFAITVGLQRRY